MAAMLYEEFSNRLDSEYSWGDFVLFLLDMDEVIVTKKIVSITGAGNSARVVLKPYLKLSDNEMLELHLRNGRMSEVQSFAQLSESFMWGHIHYSTRVWIPIAQGLMTVITLPLGGAGRVAAGRIMAPLMRRFAFKVMRKLFRIGGARLLRLVAGKVARKSVSILAKIARDTVVKTIRAYFAQIRSNQLRGRVNPSFVRTINVDRIVREAVRDSIAENVTGEIIAGIESILPGGSASGFIPPSMKERITNYVTRKCLVAMLGPITQLVKSSVQTVDFSNDQRTYSARFHQHFETELRKMFSGALLSDLVSDAVRDMMSNPNIIIGS
jgi:hypothetical protein